MNLVIPARSNGYRFPYSRTTEFLCPVLGASKSKFVSFCRHHAEKGAGERHVDAKEFRSRIVVLPTVKTAYRFQPSLEKLATNQPYLHLRPRRSGSDVTRIDARRLRSFLTACVAGSTH